MMRWIKTSKYEPEDEEIVLAYVGKNILRCVKFVRGKWYLDGSPWLPPLFWAEINWPE